MGSSSITPQQKIGVIAGNGKLHQLIEDHCKKHNIPFSFVFINNEPNFQTSSDNIIATMGQVGKILSFFKKQKVTDIILAGGVKKPNLHNIKVDLKGGILLAKILKSKILGDNSLLTTIISYIESHQYNILSVDDLLPNLHLSIGNNNNVDTYKTLSTDIELGKNVITSLSTYDIGQSVIIQNSRVIAIEAAEGTDNMIIRTKEYIEKKSKQPAILVKLKKASQDRRVDLPTIGVDTIKNLISSHIKGIVIDADNTIVLDKQKLLNFAKKNSIFIYGIENN